LGGDRSELRRFHSPDDDSKGAAVLSYQWLSFKGVQDTQSESAELRRDRASAASIRDLPVPLISGGQVNRSDSDGRHVPPGSGRPWSPCRGFNDGAESVGNAGGCKPLFDRATRAIAHPATELRVLPEVEDVTGERRGIVTEEPVDPMLHR
jgi:hypothetical protein